MAEARRGALTAAIAVINSDLFFLQDVRYLLPHLESVLEEEAERQAWDNMEVKRK